MSSFSRRERTRGYALMMALALTALVLGASAMVLQRTARTQAAARAAVQRALVQSALASGQHTARLHALHALWPTQPEPPMSLKLGDVTLRHKVGPAQDGRVEVELDARGSQEHARATSCFQRVQTLAGGCEGTCGEAAVPLTAQPRLEELLEDACQVTASPGLSIPFPPEQCDGNKSLVLTVPAGVKAVLVPRDPPPGSRLVAFKGLGTLETQGDLAWTGLWWASTAAGLPLTGAVHLTGGLVNGSGRPAANVSVTARDDVVAEVLAPVRQGCQPLYPTADGRPRL